MQINAIKMLFSRGTPVDQAFSILRELSAANKHEPVSLDQLAIKCARKVWIWWMFWHLGILDHCLSFRVSRKKSWKNASISTQLAGWSWWIVQTRFTLLWIKKIFIFSLCLMPIACLFTIILLLRVKFIRSHFVEVNRLIFVYTEIKLYF